MKQNISLILFILIFPSFLNGQSNQQKKEVDSLVKEALSFTNQYQHEKALIKATEGLVKAIKYDYTKGQADSYMQTGRAYKGQYIFDKAVESYKEAYRLRLFTLKDSCGAANAKNNMVSALYESFEEYGERKDLEQALKHSLEAENLVLGKELCSKTLTRIYINRANTYENLDSISKAIECNKKGLDLFQTTNDTTLHILGGYGLAKRSIHIDNLNFARQQLDSTLALIHLYSNRDSFLIGQIYEAMGVIELNTHVPKKALEYFEAAKPYYKIYPDESTALTYLYFNIARTYELEEEFVKAKEAYREAKIYQAKESTNSPFFEMLDTQESLMSSKEEKKQESDKLSKALTALIIALIIILIFAIWVIIKQKTINKKVRTINKKERTINELKEQHYQLKHDIVKNGLRTIDNHITVDLRNLPNNQPAYSIILKIRRMAKRILFQLGYDKELNLIPTNLKGFVQDMHQRAEETSLMIVQNYSYLDEVEDYPMSENLRNNLEAIITETFLNIQKYSNCEMTSINFTVDENGLSILMQDDGDGCDLKLAKRSGLKTISQRVKALNGNVFFESSPGEGFSIKINIPRFPEIN